MRTAERQLLYSDVFGTRAPKSIQTLDGEFVSKTDFDLMCFHAIKVKDEAIARGMTISAEIVCNNCSKESYMKPAQEILTARDNKVWRNGGKMSD